MLYCASRCDPFNCNGLSQHREERRNVSEVGLPLRSWGVTSVTGHFWVVMDVIFFFNNLDWGPVLRLPPESTAASVADCMIPRFLNIPPLSARCLSCPQPAVAP